MTFDRYKAYQQIIAADYYMLVVSSGFLSKKNSGTYRIAHGDERKKIFESGMGTLGRMVYMDGSLFCASSQAMDRVGHFVQGSFFTPEQFSKHRTVMNILEKSPNLHKDMFIAPCAAVIGDVKIDTKSSIWYGCVLTEDVNSISIGSGTNIQDNATVYVTKVNAAGKGSPTIISNDVTVGYGAVLHAYTIEDEAFIGMGATLLDGVKVEKMRSPPIVNLIFENTILATSVNLSLEYLL